MKKRSLTDILFVTIQLLLFIVYFIAPLQFSFNTIYIFKVVALIVAVIGLLVVSLAILQLNRNLTPFPTPVENGTLIQSGLYNYVRHPIYSGIILMARGYGLFSGSTWKIAIGIVLWVLFYFKSVYEEKMLLKRYSDYKEYSKRTGRFFPHL